LAFSGYFENYWEVFTFEPHAPHSYQQDTIFYQKPPSKFKINAFLLIQ